MSEPIDAAPAPAGNITYRRRHKNRGCAAGCGVALLVAIVATIAGAIGMFYAFNRAVYSVLSEERRPFTAIEINAEETKALRARVEAFTTALERGESPPELLLTAGEVNAMLEQLARENRMDNPVRVAFENDRIQAELSVPLRGLYLNGSGDISLGLSNGVLQAYVNTVEVKDKKPPKGIMELMNKHNLAQIFMDDPESARIVKRLKYVTVTNGKLKITPKAANEN